MSARRNRLSSDALEDIMFLYENEDIRYGIKSDDDDEIEDIDGSKLILPECLRPAK